MQLKNEITSVSRIDMKKQNQNVVEKLFLDPFLKNQHWAYLWTKSSKFYAVCFYCIASSGLSKYIEIKLQTTCFYFLKLSLASLKLF